jgi:hypothetical protein
MKADLVPGGKSRVALQAVPLHSRDGAPQRSVKGLLVAEPAEDLDPIPE